jgi:hypothetical protein
MEGILEAEELVNLTFPKLIGKLKISKSQWASIPIIFSV